jgi:CheY-like chemotaxis protein
VTQLHALVVDDNLQNVRVLAQLLNKQGVTSTEVTDPRKLSATIAALQTPAVIFVDLEMDEIDGFSAKNILRGQYGGVPIIAYTVHVSEMNAVRDAGFDGLLAKPLDDQRFPDQLARILRGEPVWERA